MKRLNLEEEIQDMYNALESLNEGVEAFEFFNDEQLKIIETIKYNYFRIGFLASLMMKQ